MTLGCPGGIGPEVSVLAAARYTERRPLVLLGDLRSVHHAAKICDLDPATFVEVGGWTDVVEPGKIGVFSPAPPLSAEALQPGRWTEEGGRAQLAWVDAAIAAVAGDHAAAMITGPVSKEAVVAGGSADFRGHTEHLARALGADEVVMAFWSPRLLTSLVTTHLPLAAVPAAVTEESVQSAIYWTARLLATLGGASRPLAVCGLNPHAGEHGLIGDDERRIEAGMVRAKERLRACGDAVASAIPIVGPIGAETVFRVGAEGGFSAAIAMYHDQATIPMKLLGFGDAVNISLGLPKIRTSVDHGTGYDRAGKGIADARGMEAALALAARLADARPPGTAEGGEETARRTAEGGTSGQ